MPGNDGPASGSWGVGRSGKTLRGLTLMTETHCVVLSRAEPGEGGGYKRNRDTVGGERGESQTTGDLREVLSKHRERRLVSCSQPVLCAKWRQRRGQRESEVLVNTELGSTTLYLPTPVHPVRAHVRKPRPARRGEGLGSLWPSHREASSATELLGLGISTHCPPPPAPPYTWDRKNLNLES